MGDPHLLVDARPLAHPTAAGRGIGNYTLGLLGGLVTIGASYHALVASDDDAIALDGVLPGSSIRILRRDALRQLATDDAWFVATGLFLHPISFDPIPSMVTEVGVPVAGVMYDVIPYRYPERYLTDENAARQARLRGPLARSVDLTAAISRFSAQTAVAELGLEPGTVRVIGAGVSAGFVPGDPRRLREATVVAVTGPDPRKNTDGLIRAWSRVDPALRSRFRLVIVSGGPAALLARWHGTIREAGCADSVELSGAVTDGRMVELLQQATLVVQPSLEEGFGLPVVEAAACGSPVITSDTSSLPEILDEPSATFDPHDAASMATAIERGLTDESHRTVLLHAAATAAARWRWDRVARDLVSAIVERPSRTVPRRTLRERIAVVAAPGSAAIGVRSEDEVAADPDTDVVVLVDTSATPLPTRRTVTDSWPASALGRYVKHHELDHVVTIVDDASPSVTRIARRSATHVWFRTVAPTRAESARARSIIVRNPADAVVAREAAGDGVPILVLREPPGGAPDADLRRALLHWLREGSLAGVPVTVAGAAGTLS